MRTRISASTRMVLLSALVGFSTASLAAEKTISESPAGGEIPRLDRITADVSHHFVDTREGLPSIRHLTSSRSVHDAMINSSVREGDWLTLNVSFFLTDPDSNGKNNTLASSRMTYRETDGAWELHSVEQIGLTESESSSPTSKDDC